MFVSSRDAAWLISPLLVGASFVPAIIAIVVVNRRSAGSPTRGGATDPAE
ncbi:hypothetical protein [Microbacterium sp. cf332]|nr:hypothetical protein [Microbacterium sp. cf332]SDQ85982.1 hypothetical protein SAMN04487847_2770 [Microbacterium sp. cf332]